MTITEIKDAIGISHLLLTRQLDKDTQAPTEWLSHWDDVQRVRVSIPDSVMAKIKADKNRVDLLVKSKTKEATAERAAYTIHTIFVPITVEETL